MNASGSSHPARSIAVVGGGIIGLSTAWRLAQRGLSVTVYDQSTFGGEASWAGAGMLAPGGEVEEESQLSSAALASRHMYADFVAELETVSGSNIDYQECGALELAYSAQELETLERRAAFQTKLGIPSKSVSIDRVRAFWPRVQTEGLAGARFYPEDAIVDPRDLVKALIAANRRLSVTLLERCAVHELVIAEQGICVRSRNGRTQYTAVVLAAGAWSSGIRVSGAPQIPASEPVKGQILSYIQPGQTCPTIIRGHNVYLLQRANGVLLAGASVERVGFQREINSGVTAQLAAAAGAILPHLNETTPTESWVGFRPGSDSLHVGLWHSDRLYLAYGHFRNGILLAPWTAARLAEVINTNLGTR